MIKGFDKLGYEKGTANKNLGLSSKFVNWKAKLCLLN